MIIDILTLFPKIFDGPLTESIIKRARENKKVNIDIHDLRKWTKDKHRTADDKPYGGGSGMVMKPEPIFEAVDSLCRKDTKIILMTPGGVKFTQKLAKDLSSEKHLLFICGHYEGIDERVRTGLEPLEVSIGDYIITNGSLAAMVVVDAVVRLVQGVVGNPGSIVEESFSENLLEYPQYTRPEEYRGMRVPEELLSGNHALIKKWRDREALKITKEKRPDLLKKK
jgi:tRNA (guanine37-N1)-methyltransferase